MDCAGPTVHVLRGEFVLMGPLPYVLHSETIKGRLLQVAAGAGGTTRWEMRPTRVIMGLQPVDEESFLKYKLLSQQLT